MLGGAGYSAAIWLVWLPVSWILNLPVKCFQHSRTPDTKRRASAGTGHTVHTQNEGGGFLLEGFGVKMMP